MSDGPDKDKLYEKFASAGYVPSKEDLTAEDIAESLEPVAGDAILGVMGEDLVNAFVEMSIVESKFEDFSDVIRERVAQSFAKRLSKAMANNADWLMSEAAKAKAFVNEQEVAEFFELAAKFQKLHASFWYDLREAFGGHWNERLSIRHGWHVVSVGKKVDLSA